MSNEMNLPLNVSAYGLIRDTKGQAVGDVFNPKHAAHIVRCVNSHDGLVEALEWLEKIAGTAPLHDDPARVNARAALAAARGEL